MDGQQTLVMIAGKPLTEMPQDLFIPPDALEVLLDSFTGPLDLLLYLIRRQNIDIMDIPMRMITQQYMQYIELLEKRIELAADYLVMAAMLAEIKSRLLLPMEPTSDDQMEEDPRMALVKRLQLYEQFKQAALSLDELPRWERDIFPIQLACKIEVAKKALPDVALSALLEAMQEISRRQSHQVHHLIEREPLSVRERMTIILQRLEHEDWVDFKRLIAASEKRRGLVVSFLALLELAKQALITLSQASAYMPIYLKCVKIEHE